MSIRRKRTVPEAPDTPAVSREPIELVVRRGALWRFNTLKKKTVDLSVTVLWDRRQGDRRTEPGETAKNRRNRDRRHEPPFTWELADFVVVGPTSVEGKTPARPRRKEP